MTRGTVNVKLRPIKLAFLVNPNDKKSLLKAIEINTFLWGGTYNPIIPTYKRISPKWKVSLFDSPSAKSVVSGYLDNFDPDYVVPMGKCTDYPLNIGYREKIEDVSEILAPVDRRGVPNYGIGLFEVLTYLFREEFRFQPTDTQDVCIPHFGSQFDTFFSSIFGTLPENIGVIFWENFAKRLEAQKMDCSASSYTEFFNPQKLFFRRMTMYDLGSRGRQGKPRIFFLDATKPLDIMDYWNLRAVGWTVFPVPKQFTKSDKTKIPLLDFIKEKWLPRTSSPEIYRRTTILKSRSISEDEHRNFLDSLEESKVVSQTWYPRIWDEAERKTDHVESCELIANKVEQDVSSEQEPIRFKTLIPKFIRRFDRFAKPCFANEIEWRLSNDRILFAEVIPNGSREQALAIAGYGHSDEWRLFRRGLVHLSPHSEDHLYLRNPHAEGVFTRWLESTGWAVELSPAGRIAKQMIQQLEAIGGTRILAKKGIIQLLTKMNSKGDRAMSERYVQGELTKIANQTQHQINGSAEIILQRLIEAQICQLGMEVQCPVCMQFSWYSVKAVDYELQCPKCLDQLSFPSASNKVKWSYRTLGPFSLPNQAQGAYTVLLTLRFFSNFPWFDGAMTPLMSFTAKKDKMEMEADLGLLFQESKTRHSKVELIFAECKTFNSFEKKDTDRLTNLGKTFPEAVLVFATLKESLSEAEKRILRRMISRSRKNRMNSRPFNPILILTETELIAETHFTEDWRKAEGIRAKLAHSSMLSDLLELCDFTQQVYLDMDSWNQWVDEQLGHAIPRTTPT